MQFGYFSDAAREYVITDPRTPMPWANYLGSPEYGAIVTQNAGGYSFVKSGAAGRILRYTFNQFDEPGRYVYLRDDETGDYWSATWRPVEKPLEQYKTITRHGTSYTEVESTYSGIESKTLYYVPLGASGESSFVAMQLYLALRLLDELMPNKPENDEYRVYLRQKAEEQKALITQHFWEDDRFRRGYSEQGSIIGSKNDPEASMWLNPQSWAVISGLATPEQAEKAMQTAFEQLNTPFGVVSSARFRAGRFSRKRCWVTATARSSTSRRAAPPPTTTARSCVKRNPMSTRSSSRVTRRPSRAARMCTG